MTTGRIDPARVDATTDADIAAHAAQDDAAAREDAARYVRRVRKRLGLSQADFSARINVPLETVRNWEEDEGQVLQHSTTCSARRGNSLPMRTLCLVPGHAIRVATLQDLTPGFALPLRHSE